MSAELGLQIGGLILVDNALLCQFVQHLLYLRVHSFCLCLVGRCAVLVPKGGLADDIVCFAQGFRNGFPKSLSVMCY